VNAVTWLIDFRGPFLRKIAELFVYGFLDWNANFFKQIKHLLSRMSNSVSNEWWWQPLCLIMAIAGFWFATDESESHWFRFYHLLGAMAFLYLLIKAFRKGAA